LNRRRAAIFVLAAVFVAPRPAHAFPVFDAANVAQSTISAVEDVNQTLQLALSYKLQLEQYANQLRDAVVPAVYLWDQVNETIENAQAVQKSLTDYKGFARDIHDVLNRFGDLDYYRASPCYSSSGAKAGCWGLIEETHERARFSSASQKSANDALFETIDRQHSDLEKRSKRLDRLQKNAQSAKGQLEAAQYANQLSSAQIAELRELRALLLAQQNVAVRQTQEELDRESLEQASSEAFRAGEFKESPSRSW
jgi:P-type conjugative transfer protein TrbJ